MNGCDVASITFAKGLLVVVFVLCFVTLLYCIAKLLENCYGSFHKNESRTISYYQTPIYTEQLNSYQDDDQSNWYGNSSNIARQHMEFDQIKCYPNEEQKQEQKQNREVKRIEKAATPANQYDFVSIKNDRVGIERTINITNEEGSKTVRRELVSGYLNDANTDLVLYGRLA